MISKYSLPLSLQHINLIIRIFLGTIFIWASYSKIIAPNEFAKIILNYKILPEFLINPVALTLPWIEAVSGLLLITGHFIKGCALIINFLLIIFIAAFLINIYRGLDISCGCFALSLEAKQSAYEYIARDILLLAAGIWIFYYSLRHI